MWRGLQQRRLTRTPPSPTQTCMYRAGKEQRGRQALSPLPTSGVTGPGEEKAMQVTAQSIKAPQQGLSSQCTEMMPSKSRTARLPSL